VVVVVVVVVVVAVCVVTEVVDDVVVVVVVVVVVSVPVVTVVTEDVVVVVISSLSSPPEPIRTPELPSDAATSVSSAPRLKSANAAATRKTSARRVAFIANFGFVSTQAIWKYSSRGGKKKGRRRKRGKRVESRLVCKGARLIGR